MSEHDTVQLHPAGEAMYPHRTLGLSGMKVEKSGSMSPLLWAVLLLANARVGELLYFNGLGYEVIETNDDTLTLKDDLGEQHQIPAEHVYDHPLTLSLSVYLNTLHPEYTDPLCYLLERDPAVFRLRTQAGWVINDVLWKSSGNVQYPPPAASRVKETVVIQDESPHSDQCNEVEPSLSDLPPQSEPGEMVTVNAAGQLGFGF